MATASCVSKPAPSPTAGALAFGDGHKPPRMPRAASGSSGRRFCRIYREDSHWIVHLAPGAWPSNSADDDCRLRFETLSAAIGYAIGKGLSYRVLHEPPVTQPIWLSKANAPRHVDGR